LDGGKSGLDIVRLLLSAALPWPCPVGQAEPAQATLLRDGGKICLELDVDQPLRLRRLMLQAHTGPWWLADESTEPSADCGGHSLCVTAIADDFSGRARFAILERNTNGHR